MIPTTTDVEKTIERSNGLYAIIMHEIYLIEHESSFRNTLTKCVGLADAYQQLSDELQCHFFDAGLVTTASNVDGVHLDLEQHALLGRALATHVAGLV